MLQMRHLRTVQCKTLDHTTVRIASIIFKSTPHQLDKLDGIWHKKAEGFPKPVNMRSKAHASELV